MAPTVYKFIVELNLNGIEQITYRRT